MYRRAARLLGGLIGVLLGLAAEGRPALALEGWAVFANGGSVYRCSVAGSPELVYAGDAAHACWSADGKYVYFITTGGEIGVVNNDGTGAAILAAGTNTIYCPIAPYRPDPEYVLYVEGTGFYTIRRPDGAPTAVHTDTQTFGGEIAISTDGTRMAARYVDWLYKIVVGGASETYSPKCSASISPSGEYLTRNWDGHVKMTVYTWDVQVHKELWCDSEGLEWDNQKFAANSDDHIVYKIDTGATAVGVVCVSTEEHWLIGSMTSEYPDFLVGSLPDPGNSTGSDRGGGGCASSGTNTGAFILCALAARFALRRQRARTCHARRRSRARSSYRAFDCGESRSARSIV